MINKFNNILNECLKSGDKYRKLPKGPPTKYPVLPDRLLHVLQDDSVEGGDAYQGLALAKGDEPVPVAIDLPTTEDLADLHVCGINGRNQRVSRTAFEFILARACIMTFRYSRTGEKPYFTRHIKDASAVMRIDSNVFEDAIANHTKQLAGVDDGIWDALKRIQKSQDPFVFDYDRPEHGKSQTPSSQASSRAIQIQEGLQLLCIEEAPKEKATRMVCIKDGQLLSLNTANKDIKSWLNKIYSWGEQQILIACSRYPTKSTLLLAALLHPNMGQTLRKLWFPGQNIIDQTLNKFASDANLLPRILKRGHRTPLFRAVHVARAAIVQNQEDEWRAPLSCYYRSRNYPYHCIRMEIPLLMWNKSQDAVNYAIKIAAWQHDLGHVAPQVQLEAGEQSDLTAEREMLEVQTDRALNKNDLYFTEN